VRKGRKRRTRTKGEDESDEGSFEADDPYAAIKAAQQKFVLLRFHFDRCASLSKHRITME